MATERMGDGGAVAGGGVGKLSIGQQLALLDIHETRHTKRSRSVPSLMKRRLVAFHCGNGTGWYAVTAKGYAALDAAIPDWERFATRPRGDA